MFFYNTTSHGSLGDSEQFITLRPFPHINVTANAHRFFFFFKLSILSEAERRVRDWGISEKGTDTREERREEAKQRVRGEAGQECVGGEALKWKDGRQLQANSIFRHVIFYNYAALSGILKIKKKKLPVRS